MRRCRAGRYAMILGKEGRVQPALTQEFSGREPKIQFLRFWLNQHFGSGDEAICRFGRSFDMKKWTNDKKGKGVIVWITIFSQRIPPSPGGTSTWNLLSYGDGSLAVPKDRCKKNVFHKFGSKKPPEVVEEIHQILLLRKRWARWWWGDDLMLPSSGTPVSCFFWHRACFLPRFFCFILIATVTLSWVFWMHLHCIWRRFLYILVWFPCFFSVNAGIWCRMSAQRISIPLWRTKRESLAKALGWARIELWVGSFGCQRYFTMENNKLETHFHRQNHAGGVCGNSDKMPG